MRLSKMKSTANAGMISQNRVATAMVEHLTTFLLPLIHHPHGQE